MKQLDGELRVDFVSGAVAHRLRFGGGRGQALPKAMGLTEWSQPLMSRVSVIWPAQGK